LIENISGIYRLSGDAIELITQDDNTLVFTAQAVRPLCGGGLIFTGDGFLRTPASVSVDRH
jgi:hypothetical protein